MLGKCYQEEERLGTPSLGLQLAQLNDWSANDPIYILIIQEMVLKGGEKEI